MTGAHRLCKPARLAAVALIAIAPPALAEEGRPSVDSEAHLALIMGLPERRAAVQAEHAQAIEQGVTAEINAAYGEIGAFLGDVWLELAAVWPDDHFGTADHAAYLDTFTLSRIGFYSAINTFEEDPLEPALLSTIIASRLVKDLDNFVADTATAQLSRHDPVLTLEWLAQWQEAAR